MPSLPEVTAQIARAVISGVTDTDYPLERRLRILGGFVASGLRLSSGMTIGQLGARPARPMRLWDFERCPHSRVVREALSILDLDAEVRPCPQGGTRFRPELEGGGVPRLEDPNAGVLLVGSSEIVRHLHERYGTNQPPRVLNLTPVKVATGLAARVLTGHRGGEARPSRAPAQMLELWSFEASPYSRLVRSILCELELPYLLHNVAKESPRRSEFIAQSGEMRVPYLHDPNTGVRMFGSLAIEEYLESTYGPKVA